MSHKDNLRDPSRRASILAKRASPMANLHPVMTARGPAPTLMDRLKARLSKSKYTPHVGKKQEAKMKLAAERDAIAAFA
jgi:hypothetical protein